MKKLSFLFLILLLGSQLNGQAIKRIKDPYTGISSTSTDYEYIGRVGRSGSIQFKVTLYEGKDTTLRLYIYINRLSIRCFDADSKVQINYGTGIVSLKFNEKPHCGTSLEDYAVLSKSDIKLLKENRMIGLRVNYTKDFEDFSLFGKSNYDNKADYFIRTLKLFVP